MGYRELGQYLGEAAGGDGAMRRLIDVLSEFGPKDGGLCA